MHLLHTPTEQKGEENGGVSRPPPSALLTGLLDVLPVLQEFSWQLTGADSTCMQDRKDSTQRREEATDMARDILELAMGTTKASSKPDRGIREESSTYSVVAIVQRYIHPVSQQILLQASRGDAGDSVPATDSDRVVHAAMGLHELLTFISHSNIVAAGADEVSVILNACLPLCLSPDNYLQAACLSALAKIVLVVKSTSLLCCLCLLYGLEAAMRVYEVEDMPANAGSRDGSDPIARLCSKLNIHLNPSLLQLIRQHSVQAYRLRSFVGEVLAKVIGALSESAFVRAESKDFHFVSPDLAYTIQGLAAVCISLSKNTTSGQSEQIDSHVYDIKTGKLQQAVHASLDSVDTQEMVVQVSVSVAQVYLRQSAMCILADLLVYLHARHYQIVGSVPPVQAWDDLCFQLGSARFKGKSAGTDFYSLDTLDIALGVLQLGHQGLGKNKDLEKSNAARR
ncbi:hypothetical protein EON65_51795 [archaeon]|nr:MAG: hypothetical protein EON65_51795 [archaeon]